MQVVGKLVLIKPVVLPYVHGMSEQIWRVLKPLEICDVSKAEPWQWYVCNGMKNKVPEEKKME